MLQFEITKVNFWLLLLKSITKQSSPLAAELEATNMAYKFLMERLLFFFFFLVLLNLIENKLLSDYSDCLVPECFLIESV